MYLRRLPGKSTGGGLRPLADDKPQLAPSWIPVTARAPALTSGISSRDRRGELVRARQHAHRHIKAEFK